MRVLFLTHRLPYAPNRGDRIRAFHILRSLGRIAEIHLFSLVHDKEEASHVDALRGLAASVTVVRARRLRNLARGLGALAAGRALTHVLLDGAGSRKALANVVRINRPDVVLAFCSGMARFALEPPLAGMPLVLDLVDVDSQKWTDLAERARFPRSWIFRRESRALERFEAHAAARAFATLVVNRREADLLRSIASDARIDVTPIGIDFKAVRPPGPPSDRQTVVFCGVMNYPPNEEAAIWLARDIWPLVRSRHPKARLLLVGADPTRALRRLPFEDNSIQLTGRVPDVRPFLWNASVSVAPLLISRGVQNKVLEAVAAGLPVVITPTVAQGLPAEAMSACRVAGDPRSMADRIVHLLNMRPEERRGLAQSADLTPLAWEARLAPLGAILREAVASQSHSLPIPTQTARGLGQWSP